MLLTPQSNPQPIVKPPVNPSEAFKYQDNGRYFFDMNRWLVYQYYNRYYTPTSNSNITPPLASVAAGVPIVDEMLTNYQFYYGMQGNDTFGYMTKTSSGGDIPAVWISGQKIRQLVDHIKGNVLETVKPMGKNITAESVSKDAVIKKKDIFSKIDFAAKINPIIEAAGGMAYQPMGAKNYSDKKDYSKAVNEARTQFEKDATILAKNVYYTNSCQTQFVEDDTMSAAIANLCATHITERDGQVIQEPIPPFNCLAGETKVLTKEFGEIEIRELEGVTCHVLTSNRIWEQAEFNCFGKQKLYKITAGVNSRHEISVFATGNHNWIIGDKRKTTLELVKGDILPFNNICRDEIKEDSLDYRLGVIHGLIYGDGTATFQKEYRTDRQIYCQKRDEGYVIRLCGDQQDLLPFFEEYKKSYPPSSSGDPHIYMYDDFAKTHLLKELPVENETDDYMVGFFRGWIAADGCVTKKGQATICISGKEQEWIKKIMPKYGYLFTTHSMLPEYTNYGKRNVDSRVLRLFRPSLNKNDFLIKRKRDKFSSFDCELKIREITETDRFEDVYCATVETTHDFTLGDGILTGNCVFDFSSTGQYGENQRFGGFVVPITYEEAVKETPDMPKEWKEELQKVFSAPALDYTAWANFYNEPFQNVKWWYNDQKYFTKSVMYWIEKKDSRTQVKKTAFGSKKSRRIEDHKPYQVSNQDGTVNNVMGYDLKGDNETYMVHYSIVYGNKYLAKYGYETFQVRPAFNKKMPQIPMFYYCPSKMAGYVRSIVSRLRRNQNELDRLAYKIQQLTANDLGKVFFIKGEKIGEGVTPREIVDDLKSFKISLLPPTGDAASDALGAGDLITAVDMSNNQFLTSYIELKREQIAEMEAIVSIPAMALGQQTTITGKGVQENTISQSTLSMMSFYEGLTEFFRRKLQYSVNKQKLIYATKPGTYVLPISESQTEILEITKNFRFEDLLVYLQVNDQVDARNKNSLYQLLLAFSQNAGQNPLGAAQALLAGVKMLKFQSFGEGIEMLENYVEDLTTQQTQAQQQQALIQNNQMQYETQSKQIADTQAQMARIYEMLLKTNLTGAWAVKNTEAKAAAAKEDEMVINSAIQEQGQLDPRNQQPQQ